MEVQLPSITKNIGSYSYRTPTQIIGSADLSFLVEKKTERESIIEALIEEHRSILDIGCGDGMLMQQLEKNLNAKTYGIEIN